MELTYIFTSQGPPIIVNINGMSTFSDKLINSIERKGWGLTRVCHIAKDRIGNLWLPYWLKDMTFHWIKNKNIFNGLK